MEKGLKVIIFFHFAIIIGNLLAIGFLAVNEPWWVSIPLITFLLNLVTNSWNCPLTILENKIRKKLGLPQIRSFIKHYVIKNNENSNG